MEHLRFKSEQTAAAYVADELDPAQQEAFELHMMSCLECVEDVEQWRAIKNRMPQESTSGQASEAALPEVPVAPRHAADASPAESCDELATSGTGAQGPPRHSRKGKSATPRHAAKPDSADPDTPTTAAALPPRRPAGGRWRLPSAVAASLVAGTVGGWYVRSMQGPSVDAQHIGFFSLPPLSRGPADCMSLKLQPGVSLLVLRIPGAVPEQQLVPVDSEGHDLAPESYSVQMQGDASWLVRLPASTVREQGIRFEARSPDGTVEPRGCVINAAQQ